MAISMGNPHVLGNIVLASAFRFYCQGRLRAEAVAGGGLTPSTPGAADFGWDN